VNTHLCFDELGAGSKGRGVADVALSRSATHPDSDDRHEGHRREGHDERDHRIPAHHHHHAHANSPVATPIASTTRTSTSGSPASRSGRRPAASSRAWPAHRHWSPWYQQPDRQHRHDNGYDQRPVVPSKGQRGLCGRLTGLSGQRRRIARLGHIPVGGQSPAGLSQFGDRLRLTLIGCGPAAGTVAAPRGCLSPPVSLAPASLYAAPRGFCHVVPRGWA
jgi:hypothetical protein